MIFWRFVFWFFHTHPRIAWTIFIAGLALITIGSTADYIWRTLLSA